MIHIIITSYKEPKATLNAVKKLLEQKTKENLKIIVVDPFIEVGDYIKENVKDKRVEFFLDPGEGKPYALNMLFEIIYSNNKNEIIVFTDGDVYVGKNAIKEIIKPFKDKKVGCVTGRPYTLDKRTTKYGYWSKLLYGGIHKVRKKLDKENKFFQCSGYLFAIRNGVIKEIPVDVPEDSIIPYLFWKESYKIKYADRAEVYVKYPDNWKDWVNQRVRTIKAHENIPIMAPDMPRTKSFLNEAKEGLLFVISFPRSLKEYLWTIELVMARAYIYFKSFWEIKRKKVFNPGWRETEISSTKPFD